MATNTFLNLSPEKQKALEEAAYREFSRVTLEEASINKIIVDVGISRGSFYTYFKNKEDIYAYILKKYRKKCEEKILSILKEENGDYFKAFEEILNYFIEITINKKNDSFYRNIFRNMNLVMEDKMLLKCKVSKENEFLNEFIKLINTENMKNSSKEDLIAITNIMMHTTMMSIPIIINESLDIETVKKQYLRTLDIIKFGIYKN